MGSDASPGYFNGGKDRTCYWWTRTTDYPNKAYIVDFSGNSFRVMGSDRSIGARPVVTYSEIKAKILGQEINPNGVKEVEYGYYPQWIVDEYTSKRLEELYNSGKAELTGRCYTADKVSYLNSSLPFQPMKCQEYSCYGRKYIRYVYEVDNQIRRSELSNYQSVIKGQAYWLSVKPIVWLVDEDKDIAISKYVLFSGIQYNNKADDIIDFKNTDIYKFMNNYLTKEITQDNIYVEDNTTSSVDSNVELSKQESCDVDSIFEEALLKMNEISGAKPKIKTLK